jgi:hypothetical protein
MSDAPNISFSGIRTVIPNPNVAGMVSIDAPIQAVRASPEFYRFELHRFLRAQNMWSIEEIAAKVEQATYTEITFMGMPFIIDATIPAGKAYFQLAGQLS